MNIKIVSNFQLEGQEPNQLNGATYRVGDVIPNVDEATVAALGDAVEVTDGEPGSNVPPAEEAAPEGEVPAGEPEEVPAGDEPAVPAEDAPEGGASEPEE